VSVSVSVSVSEERVKYPLMIRFPCGLKMTHDTEALWPAKVFTNAPVLASNNRTVLSYPPVAM